MPSKLLGAAAEYIEAQYGGPVGELTADVVVGTTSAEVLRNDPERLFALLVNLSVNTIYIGYEQGVSSSSGIVLAASGGTYQVDVKEDFMLPTRSMFAVATDVTSALYVVTVRRIARSPIEGE